MPLTKLNNFLKPRQPRETRAAQTIKKALLSAYGKNRKKKALTKPASKAVRSVVKREIGRQSETFRNFGRYTFQDPTTALTSFQDANYFLINIGGVVALSGQTAAPMRTINAIPTAWNQPTVSTYNQSYKGVSIYSKSFQAKINLVMPSLRTLQTGSGQDQWQNIPTNYEYRLVIFKTKDHPSRSSGAVGNTQGSFVTTGFRNVVGQAFGINSPDSEAMPDPTGTPLPWTNHDLMWSVTNKTNFKILKERRGRISVASSAQATNNPLTASRGASTYPSEANFTFNLPINKKLNLNYDVTTPAGALPTVPAITNYDSTIGMFLCLCPLGSSAPVGGSQGTATNLNDIIQPYIHVATTMSFTDS